jgi:hypothetical protein
MTYLTRGWPYLGKGKIYLQLLGLQLCFGLFGDKGMRHVLRT